MNELHDKSIGDTFLKPEVGQRDLACSNKKSLRCLTSGFLLSKELVISEETYRKITGDLLSTKEQIIERVNFLEGFLRNRIKNGLKDYVKNKK